MKEVSSPIFCNGVDHATSVQSAIQLHNKFASPVIIDQFEFSNVTRYKTSYAPFSAKIISIKNRILMLKKTD